MHMKGVRPLSFAQQRMWFLDQLDPNNTLFNVPVALRLSGTLDVPALQAGLGGVLRRHESLRTTFPTDRGQPVQVVSPESPFHLPVVPATEEEARRLASEEARRPFDLARGPLVRGSLLRLAEREHVLLLTAHHMVSDGWSMRLLIQELAALYQASPLPELPFQYADYAARQRQWLQGEALETQLSYWKRQLQGAPQALELPTDKPRPAIQTFRGASHSFALPKGLSDALKALGQKEHATDFMVLLAAFQALLHRYTGQGDLSVGSPVAGRHHEELKPLIGCFANTLVMRTRLSGSLTFRELLGRVREVVLGAQAHQDVPFEKLVEELQPTRDLSRSPLFQVLFALQDAPPPQLALPGLTLRTFEAQGGTAKHELSLSLDDTAQGFTGAFEYNTDLFEPATIARMAGHLRTLLEALVTNPERRLSKLPLLTQDERRTLLVDWNETRAEHPAAACMHQLFEAQVKRAPDAVALVHRGQALSYAELNRRANRLAHRLRALGIGPDARVGICAERSADMVVAMLAAQKAGGAYVPLDPAYPPERLGLVLDDAAPRVVLTDFLGQPALRQALRLAQRTQDATVLHMQADAAQWAGASELNPEVPGLDSAHLGYLIYTSGSTGRPKGVAIAHRHAVNLIHWAQRAFSPEELRNCLFSTSINFDLSIYECFVPLSSGGTVTLVDNVLALLNEPLPVTLINTVPSAMAELTRAGAIPPTVRTVNVAGEVLKQALAERILSSGEVRRLCNLYGPSETTTYSTWTSMDRASGFVSDIGRPVANTQLYVLDANLQPVPIGIPGELYIGGDGVARGYLDRPELTAEKFVPHPFSAVPGERLYRTGDLARYRPNGVLEFLGRQDSQVKVRGFRIELGEIEAVLGQHPAVQEVVVLAREDAPGDKRLVAYAVIAAGRQEKAEALRAFLARKLPPHMVPSAFVLLEALPLTPNGKVDRKALPAPDHGRADQAFEAPRTATEQVLAEIWAEVLGVERVGIHDGFFELGGHSLLATRVVSRLRGAFQVELPLRELFASPTVAGLASRVEEAVRAGQGLQAPPLKTFPRTGELPLSFAQQRLWFLDQLIPDSALYNMSAALRLEGALDVPALERSFRELFRRHESLRTTYRAERGQPVQVIAPESSFHLPVVTATEEEARRLASEDALKPFDLSRGPLLRGTLLRLGEREHVLLLAMHHIVSDDWSMGVLFRELAALYEGSPLPELPVQYADYAAWQRQWLQGEVLEAQLAYWRRQLAGAQALELPADRPRPAVQTFRGASHSFALPRDLSEALKALGRSAHATDFMVLLAAFQALLHRYTGQDDISVGSTIAGRHHEELEPLIGFFVNTLVMRTRLSGSLTFRELLDRVREVALGAYAHQDAPFEKLVEALQPQRDLSRSPLFQALLVLQNAPPSDLALPGLTLRPLEAQGGTTAKLELSLFFTETAEGLAGTFEYNTDLFDPATIARMAGHLRTLLEGAVADPDRRLCDLPLLTEDERRTLLVEWNDSGTEIPEGCAHQLFERNAARAPDAPALSFEGREITYAELNRRANQLAHHLRALGVGPEVRVGLCVERSPDLIVGMLGVLKAGGAYVPLDPAYPPERLSFMLSDSAAPVLVTQRSSALPSAGEQRVSLDELSRQPEGNLDSGATADTLAYVIYTSGSTGQPKGTLLQHRGLVNTALATAKSLGFRPDSRVLQFAPSSFDASVCEVFSTLLAGSCLVLAPRDRLLPNAPLRRLLEEERVTVTGLPPSVLVQLEADGLPHLETVLSAGETCTPEVARRWSQGRALLNAYGPTEVTVFCSITPGPVVPERITIGRTWPNSQLYVLDPELRLLPVGVPGELYVGGMGLARGYHGRPDLTAEKFVPNPFSAVPGERLYRTGDLVRWLPDGELDYLGRIDTQVKVRGFRIELGEIEAVLGQHPAVQQVSVLAREDTPGNKRLVAYVVMAAGQEAKAGELRAFLEKELPQHMVPSAFVVLEALPLTPNGKVDRKALPAPSQEQLGGEREYVAPRTPTEELLAGAWAQVLGVEKVGVHDDFFELGGHSLLATQVLSRIRGTFQVELPLRELFAAPTVAGLASRVEAAAKGTQAPPLKAWPRTGELPLSFAQQRLWFLDQLVPNSPLYNIPVALRLSGTLDVPALQESFRELLRRHESLRTTFRAERGQPVQVISPDPSFSLRVVPATEEEARKLAVEEAQQPFDLARGPLVRATLLRLGEREHVLLLTMHHAVSDGWSMGVLVRELMALYQAAPLPELPFQYADYAAWQRQWLQGEVLDAQLSYWREQLKGAPQALELPTDKPRPPLQTFGGAVHTFTLPKGLSEALKALGRREHVTDFMVLLAAFQALLHRYTGQDDISVGAPIAGRRHQELEPLIGFFVNTLVMRTRLSGELTFRELLGRVRDVALGAYAHQDVPFEKLVEELQPRRDLSRPPLFQVVLVLQNAPLPELSLPGLSVRPFEAHSHTAKFDLELSVDDTAQGFAGTFEYNTDLFEPATVARMAGHLRTLLESVVADAGQRLEALPLLTERERAQALGDWNATAAPHPEDACLQDLFEAQVKRTPEATAVVFGDRRLSYREVNRRANFLARRLREGGARPNTLVAVVLDKGWEQVVAALAIVKSGAAYVPIDPKLPADRIRHLLEHGQVRAAFTRRELDGVVPWPSGVERLWVEEAPAGAAGDQDLPRTQRPGDLAYVIYTSGSTGQPKGVMLDHRGPVNTIADINRRFGIGPRDGVLAVSALNFDLSVYDIFGMLAAGGTVVLPEKEGARDPQYWADLVAREGVTLWNSVPALVEMLVDHAAGPLGSLRLTFMSGDWIPVTLPDRLKRLVPGITVISMGGATEASIWSILYPIERVEPGWRSIPYGRPMANQRFYVLDQTLEPAPIGVEGGLYIGGIGLAQGYWREEGLTKASFFEHPRTKERLYRTGDQGRYLADGTIEFLGRKDFQVKVRGFRIELGEIEVTLTSHPSVRQAVVMVREDVPGDRRLVGYVVAEAEVSLGELKSYLQGKLPEYMVPAALVAMEALPLSANGKVDRKALPAPDRGRAAEQDFEAPRTETERRLAEIWAQVLGLERVGIRDNFFELGGHSLLATQAVSRIRSAFQIELPLRELFVAPTVAGLAPKVEAGQGVQAPPLQVFPRTGDLPLSFAQQRLWFLDQLEPNSPLYNIPVALQLSGALDVRALEKSLAELLRRHESLRTTFRVERGQPVQVISPARAFPLEVVDATEEEARRLANEEALKPFDLARGPLVRGSLLRLGEREHVLLLTMHHSVSDGWSLGILIRELAALYGGSPLPELRFQYADYAAWQRQWLQGEVLESQLSYWKQQLKGAPQALELPTDKPRPAVQTFRGASYTFALPKDLSEAIKALSRSARATDFMVLLAAFQVLLHRYTGQDDVSVGTPIAGRNREELEPLIGFFVNTLVMRARLSGDLAFRELLDRVRDAALGAYAHQDVPFEKLVEELQPTRDLSRSPLFQVLFAVQNAPPPELAAPGLTLRRFDTHGEVPAKFELSLSLDDTAQGFAGTVEYNTDLFEPATIARMAGHFRTLLEGVTANPERRVSELPLLTEGERRTLLVDWNETRAEYPSGACMHQLFEAQVRRTPDAVALVHRGQGLTYAELNRRANRLAHRLRALGVGPDARVGICSERSIDLVTAMLATQKAGGAYVPLDPTYPPERLGLVLDDAMPRVVLTDAVGQPVLKQALALAQRTQDAAVLQMQADAAQWEHASEENPEVRGLDASHLGYLIYTSGSTGRPKGVAIAHRNAVNFIHWAQRAFSAEELRNCLFSTSVNFDLSIFESFVPLSMGGTVTLVDNALALLNESPPVTLINTVPSAMAELTRSGAIPRTVRTVNVAGEVLKQALADRILSSGEVRRLCNLYGPSETTTYSTWTEMDRASGFKSDVGRPVANTQVYVLDANFQPVPAGVLGELFIGGDGVARGYLDRPELTAEKFVPNPHATIPGERLYRTGDVARYLPDGRLEFLGRRDSQVKVRGFRIELGEIETVLAQHPAVQEVVVLAREDIPGDKRLAAYVVIAAGRQEKAEELRAFLAKKLPPHMVPSAFVLLEALPLTPNGKVDRKALPAPSEAHLGTGKAFVAPRTPTEALLAGAWAQVLGVEKVGIHDNFFELGGHSLLATQVLSRIRGAFQIELPLRELFAASTVAGLAPRVEEAVRAGQGLHVPPLKAVARTGDLPPSFAQQRLWFLDQLIPGSSLYNVPVALRLSGALDVPALEKGLRELVRRHESLRTTFRAERGQPVQVISPEPSFHLPVVPATEEEARRLASEEAQKPFDLARGPLLRGTLLRLGEREHVLLLTMHHIVSDGWSIGVLVRELMALYQAAPLPELRFQYADYAAWQRQWLRGEVLESQLSYWRQQLLGAQVLELPTDKPRPPAQTFRGASHSFALPRELAEGLKRLSQSEQVTDFMVLLAAFQALLHRYTGQDDISVGSPIAGRNHEELEPLIGFFVNTLVMRTRLSGGLTFRELLGRVRDVALGAYAHQDVPFEKLVEELQPARDLSRSPLFQVLLVLQNAPLPEPALPGLTLRTFDAQGNTAKFDLSVAFEETEQGLAGWIEYNTDLFEPATVARMAGHLRTLLERIVANPEQRLSDLPLLADGERRALLVEWNDSGAEIPEGCAHQLFERNAARAPDAPALAFEGQQLTYAELNRRANQLAHHLRSLGVGPEVRVGLCVDRSPDLIVGMLGVLKAGGAYVPLDPAYPPERLSFMMSDSAAPVLVTQRKSADALPSAGEQRVYLEELTRQPEDNLDSGATADNLAYVIYTSGSTGQPKGTLLQHRGLINTALATAKSLGFRPDSRVLQFAPSSFDASVCEVFSALLAGSCLVLAPRERLMPNEPLRRLLEEQRVTVTGLPPSVLVQLEADGLPHLETVLTAGETCTPEVARRWSQGRALLNAYGPTEVTVFCSITPGPLSPDRITIGRTWPNSQLYVLDAGLRLLPAGVPGELYVGGVGLARGYHGRPDLTAEKFVPNPFSTIPGDRLYRTGDLVRWFPDGELDYLGRIDTQVKVRGFRIELGEIEAVLGKHPAVQETAVLAREDTPGNKRLVAYVVMAAGQKEQAGALRAFLEQELPQHMVPSAFVVLDAFPLTPNGKVDRKALPAPTGELLDREKTFVAPRTPTEELLAGVWAQVLGVEKVGIHDDFFELGGHSLLATQVLSRLRGALQVELPLRDLFAAPTVAGLASRVEAAAKGTQAPPLKAFPRTGELPLSFAQQRLWFLDQLVPDSPLYNIPVALRLSGTLDVPALQKSLGELVRRHESLRTTFRTERGQPIQVISPDAAFRLPVVAATEEEARRLAGEEAQKPFDLSRGPLVRGTLLRLGEREHVLLLTMHHIVSDGWSLGVLIRELAALYEGAPLPELPFQYPDYAAWQRQWLQGEALQAQLSYWKRQLEGAEVLELPTDRPRPPVQTFRGASHHFLLPRALSDALQALGRRAHATDFMVLLAAFQALLHRYTGQDDISIGSPIAGRHHEELEPLIGFFVNTLVMRTRLSGDLTFRELLDRVRDVALGAYAHQDVPFEKLVEELQPRRDLSRSALFQALLVLQNAPLPELALPGLTLRPFDAQGNVTAKFDLSVAFEETAEGLSGSFEYNTDLFDAATIARMAEHLRTLLEGVVARPDQRLFELPLLTQDERRTLVEWNDTRAEPAEAACLHELFEAQVERTPDAVALEYLGKTLSFRELNRRANQLARHLRRLGVGPETTVALHVERSVEMLVGVLGVWKAGGAYVPIDPAYPAERVEYMRSDAAVKVVLAQQELATEWGLPDDNLPPAAQPDNLAYVIYTSGSTGKPKGVMVQHRSACNLLEALSRTIYAGVQGPLRVSLNAPLSFDASVKQLIQLCRGHALCVIPEVARRDVNELLSWIARYRLDVLDCTPSHLRLLLDAGLATRTDGVPGRVLIGGEALDEATWSALAAHPRIRFFNVYGPTECTVNATACEARAAPEGPTIGRPLPNMRAYVLDRHLRPVPVGVAGELHVGGRGVTRGYLGRPELTAERFVPDPFGGEPGARLYRTGDLVRHRAGGTLEFLGRIDHQVKLRGFRIELGEVESVLAQHPSVRKAAAMLREDVPGNPQLVAYAVLAAEQPAKVEELRAFLEKKLPQHMVPSAFVVLDALPLTTNGKLDRKALPAPDRATPAGAYVGPRDALEIELVRIWEELLRVQPISVTSNFFELGGHSLLAVELTARIQESTGRRVAVASLFEGSTVEKLADLMRQEPRPWSPLVPIWRGGRRRPFFCVHPAGGNVACYADLARALGPDQPFYGLQAPGLDGDQPPYETLEAMAALYIDTIRTIQPAGPYLLGGWSLGGSIAFEMAQQLRRRGEPEGLLALFDSRAQSFGQEELQEEDDLMDFNLRFLREGEELFGLKLDLPEEALRRAGEEQVLGYLLEGARKANIVVSTAGLRQIRGLRDVYFQNLRASGKYVRRPYGGTITLFSAKDEASPSVPKDRGWGALSARPLELYEVPGEHRTLMSPPFVERLAEQLKACLARP